MTSTDIALVTGARGGVGSALVARLRARGLRVAAVGRDAASLASVDADAHIEADVTTPEGAAAALEGGAAPEGYTIKGNKDSMKYHEPDGQWYDQTVAELWFRTAEAAEAAGFTKAGA